MFIVVVHYTYQHLFVVVHYTYQHLFIVVHYTYQHLFIVVVHYTYQYLFIVVHYTYQHLFIVVVQYTYHHMPCLVAIVDSTQGGSATVSYKDLVIVAKVNHPNPAADILIRGSATASSPSPPFFFKQFNA